MSDLFYRWHQNEAPPFSAENAWSADWGSDFTDDGSARTCPYCGGTGEGDPRDCSRCEAEGCWYCDHSGELTDCTDCDGDGTIDCERGYSCYEDPADLADYFGQRGCPTDDTGTVYVFEGELTGAGTDGEPLAVPEHVVETLTWSELIKRTETEPVSD